MNFPILKPLLIFITILLSVTANAETPDCQQHQCIAVIDAGSTGSRAHIYAYDFDNTQTPINIKEVWSKKVKPGLATLMTDQATINSYFSNLFSDAPTANLPVYLYATAGMRLQPQPKQTLIYGLVKNWFNNQPQWQLQAAKTITGTEEGLYAWLMLNYQLGSLNSNEKSTVGVMDVGGASVQIVFPVENTEGLNNSDLVQFEIYGQQKKLFIHSFLGLGQDEVTHQYLDSASCFPKDYQLTNGQPANGDTNACTKEISSLINEVHQVNQIVQPTMQSNPTKNWYILGAAAELAQSKPFQDGNQQFTNETLLEQANQLICQQPWEGLSSQYPGNDYLYGYCLFPSYYYTLMVKGYGIPAEQKINFLPTNKAADWSLGVVLKQTP